jgi:predicted nuclease of predicted toxin-antitoxin system
MRTRVKLDENLGTRGVQVFQKHGHDVASVAGQGLQSSSDRDLIRVCAHEDRCLVTLDLDFSQPLQFPPHEYDPDR